MLTSGSSMCACHCFCFCSSSFFFFNCICEKSAGWKVSIIEYEHNILINYNTPLLEKSINEHVLSGKPSDPRQKVCFFKNRN